jgi:hypothetical protein
MEESDIYLNRNKIWHRVQKIHWVGGKGGSGGRGEKWTKPCMHIWIIKEKWKKKKIHCQVNTSHCNVILKCGMDNFKEKIYLKISGIWHIFLDFFCFIIKMFVLILFLNFKWNEESFNEVWQMRSFFWGWWKVRQN